MARNKFAAPLLRPEEESFFFVRVVVIGNEDRAADGVTPVVLLVLGHGLRVVIEEILSIESIVATEIIGVAMEVSCP